MIYNQGKENHYNNSYGISLFYDLMKILRSTGLFNHFTFEDLTSDSHCKNSIFH